MIRVLRLRELAATVGLTNILTFRPYAEKMYENAINILGQLNPNSVIDCSFDEIDVCDVSFVDQFILNMQMVMMEKDNIIFRLSNCKQDVLDNISGALAVRNEHDKMKTKLCLLYYKENRYSILGRPEQSLKDTLDFVQFHIEGVTARELADKCGISEINAASNRLKRLYDAGFSCRKTETFESGWQNIYYIPTH